MTKFFTYEERLILQKHLKNNHSFKEIGRELIKHPTTISREVRSHMFELASGYPGAPYNPCRNRGFCKRKNLCGRQCSRNSASYCRFCQKCNEVCFDFLEERCLSRYHAPYVCNGCEQLSKCTLMKHMYEAERAHIESHKRLSDARSGLCTSEAEIARLNAIITPLIRKGQSVHQIYATYKNELMCSEKTVYNYIDAGLLDVRNIDLPRKVTFRERYKKPEFKVDRGCRIGRNYADFQAHISSHPDTPIVQMDSVIGNRGGKCLLTIHFVDTSLMLAYLRDANTSQSVIDIYNQLNETLGIKQFQKLFPVILTDNGSEFSNPRAIERKNDNTMGNRTWIYYCDAGRPYQKGAIEVNHSLIRRVLKKGSSFDHLCQEDITLMMNHINSYKRKKLNDRTPYEAFSFYHGEEVLEQLGCHPVAAEDIMLKPALLKK